MREEIPHVESREVQVCGGASSCDKKQRHEVYQLPFHVCCFQNSPFSPRLGIVYEYRPFAISLGTWRNLLVSIGHDRVGTDMIASWAKSIERVELVGFGINSTIFVGLDEVLLRVSIGDWALSPLCDQWIQSEWSLKKFLFVRHRSYCCHDGRSSVLFCFR